MLTVAFGTAAVGIVVCRKVVADIGKRRFRGTNSATWKSERDFAGLAGESFGFGSILSKRLRESQRDFKQCLAMPGETDKSFMKCQHPNSVRKNLRKCSRNFVMRFLLIFARERNSKIQNPLSEGFDHSLSLRARRFQNLTGKDKLKIRAEACLL